MMTILQIIKGKVACSIASASSPTPRQLRQDDSVQGLVAIYESKQCDLQKENKQLKYQLAALEKQYVQVVNKLEARETAQAATDEAAAVIDQAFVENIPHMSAGQLSAEISSRLQVLKRRIGSLDWHAHRFEATDGTPSVREKQLGEDLQAARAVLHDQEFMLTNVLTAMRTAIIREQQQFEAKLRESNKRFQDGLEEAKRKFAQDKRTLDEEGQAQIFCLKQEYEREVRYHKEQIAELEDKVKSTEDRIEHLKSSHQARLEEGLAKARAEFDAKADDIRAGADATIESMAAESSRIQLDYKKTHNALREELEALRQASQIREVEIRNAAEAELKAKFQNEMQIALKAELKAQECLETEKLQQLEVSYSSKIDMLLREKEQVDARTQSLSEELATTKGHLEEARRDLGRAEQKILELQDGYEQRERAELDQRSASLEISRALEMTKSQHEIEKQGLLEMIEGLEDSLRLVRRDASEQDEIVRQSRLKEQEAKLTIAKYGDMSQKYADLLRVYAPGLGAGGFLERGIAREAAGVAG